MRLSKELARVVAPKDVLDKKSPPCSSTGTLVAASTKGKVVATVHATRREHPVGPACWPPHEPQGVLGVFPRPRWGSAPSLGVTPEAFEPRRRPRGVLRAPIAHGGRTLNKGPECQSCMFEPAVCRIIAVMLGERVGVEVTLPCLLKSEASSRPV